jgi:hypothetical protein
MPTGFAASAAEFGRQIIPGDTRFEHEQDTSEDHSIFERFTSWIAFSSRRMRRQQRLNAFPKGVGDKRFHDRAPFP